MVSYFCSPQPKSYYTLTLRPPVPFQIWYQMVAVCSNVFYIKPLACSRFSVSGDDPKAGERRVESGIEKESYLLSRPRLSPARFFDRPHWPWAWNRLSRRRRIFTSVTERHVWYFYLYIVTGSIPWGDECTLSSVDQDEVTGPFSDAESRVCCQKSHTDEEEEDI